MNFYRFNTIFLTGVIILGGILAWNFESPMDILSTDQILTLQDPEMAPKDIAPLVMQGFHILEETQKYVPQYAGDRITCSNCHFACGNTFGQAGDGISLVGVPQIYPKTLADDSILTLPQRINNCFEKSMNGKPLPEDSIEMEAIITYLEWISSGVAKAEKFPWLGLTKLRSKHEPDPRNGATVYLKNCASCHGKNGEGQKRDYKLSYPPVWGEHSFNNEAGLNRLEEISSFIYFNMPYEEPLLTVEDALDVGAFIISKPRPQRKK